jgi:energy-coupling factor transport system permease protein
LTSAILNGLTVHFGRTVLFQLPRSWPLLGGAITLEAIVFGLLNGLTLTGIYAAFSVITQTLSVRALIRLIPQTFYPVAVVAAIAVTFVPITLRQLQQIREAQAIRGHRVRGLRDWLPLIIPLLIGGLERALQLAEAMTARGFASVSQPTQDLKSQLAVAFGLLMLLSGWLLRLGWAEVWLGTGLLLSGVTLILVTMWRVGQRVPRTLYRPDSWHWRDSGVVVGLSLSGLIFIFPLPFLDRSSIFYYPYPALTWPQLHGAIIVAVLGLLSPILVRGEKKMKNEKLAEVYDI